MERMRAYLAATPSGDGRTFHPGHPEVLISEALALLATATRERDDLLAENFTLAANQCDGPMIGDERGHFHCAALAAARQQAIEECAKVIESRKPLWEEAEAVAAAVRRLAGRAALKDIPNHG